MWSEMFVSKRFDGRTPASCDRALKCTKLTSRKPRTISIKRLTSRYVIYSKIHFRDKTSKLFTFSPLLQTICMKRPIYEQYDIAYRLLMCSKDKQLLFYFYFLKRETNSREEPTSKTTDKKTRYDWHALMTVTRLESPPAADTLRTRHTSCLIVTNDNSNHGLKVIKSRVRFSFFINLYLINVYVHRVWYRNFRRSITRNLFKVWT